MTVDQILDAIDDLLGQFDGDELVLMSALDQHAEAWRMRREELEDEE